MRITIGILAAAISVACTTSAATLCEQEFTVYGKTKGDHSLLFWHEYLTGECGQHRTYAIYLSDTGSVELDCQWCPGDWVPAVTANLPMESAIEVPVGDSCVVEDSIVVSPPPFDSTFPARYRELVKSGARGTAGDWNRLTFERGRGGERDYPVFWGTEAHCIYAHDRGLYKNYGFQRVLYFAESRYVVIITDQPHTAIGLDTLHGLLVFKLLGENDETGQ